MEEHPQARYIVDSLHQAGFIAYYAGGWVRDYLLQHPSDDIDIATNAPPESVQALFPHTVPIGLSFGIILVIVDRHQYEVATFRQDFDYQDGRRPAKIAFTTAEEDAKRRDFTINGMFYDPIQEKILDYVGGKEDLNARLIRAIGNPHERICEDRLRMIRALRLSCRFGFTIEEKTQDAIRAHAKELFPSVAIERVMQELEKSRAFHTIYEMFRLLFSYDLLSSIFPELQHLSKESFLERIDPIQHYPQKAPLIASILALFPEKSRKEKISLCKTLKLSLADQRFSAYLHSFSDTIKRAAKDSPLVENIEWAKLYAEPLCDLVLAILAAHHPKQEANDFLKEHAQRKQALSFSIERITQKDPVLRSVALQKAGIFPGKAMGLLLKEAERISCNEQIFDVDQIIERLRQTPLWPAQDFSSE